MAQQEQFVLPYPKAAEDMKAAIARGQHPEMIPDYRPIGTNHLLFADIALFYSFPDVMPVYETEDPEAHRTKIRKMTKALDTKIMSDPRKERTSGFSAFEVAGIETAGGTHISLKRREALGNISVAVKNIFQEGNTLSHIENEEFLIDNKGNFTMKQSVRNSPDSGGTEEKVFAYTIAQSDFSKIAEQYDYFCQLVQPYLLH